MDATGGQARAVAPPSTASPRERVAQFILVYGAYSRARIAGADAEASQNVQRAHAIYRELPSRPATLAAFMYFAFVSIVRSTRLLAVLVMSAQATQLGRSDIATAAAAVDAARSADEGQAPVRPDHGPPYERAHALVRAILRDGGAAARILLACLDVFHGWELMTGLACDASVKRDDLAVTDVVRALNILQRVTGGVSAHDEAAECDYTGDHLLALDGRWVASADDAS